MFKKAEKKRAFLRIALTGPSGSGKSFSALRLAKGIGGKVAVLDTENGSASLYSDKFDFDVVEVTAPFTPMKYVEVIEAAEKAGYSILVIDSLSHVWEGEGGVLDKKGELDEQPGSNHWTNWRKPKAAHQRLKEAILQSNIHIITTMRAKQAYAQVDDGKGKQKIQKLGMDPIAEPGIEYEFTTVFDVFMNHKASTSKDRTSLFEVDAFQITEDTGKAFIDWLGGEPVKKEKPVQAASAPKLNDSIVQEGVGKLHRISFGKYENWTLERLTKENAIKYLEWLEGSARKTNKPLSEPAQAFKDNLNLWLNEDQGLPDNSWQNEDFEDISPGARP